MPAAAAGAAASARQRADKKKKTLEAQQRALPKRAPTTEDLALPSEKNNGKSSGLKSGRDPQQGDDSRSPTTESTQLIQSTSGLANEVADAVGTVSPSAARSIGLRSEKTAGPSASVSYKSREPNYLWHQKEVRKFYDAPNVQIAVAGLIMCNFFVSATNAQLPPNTGKSVFLVFEVFFNVCFTIELIVNMYGRFFCSFWKSLWNVFDFVIVQISIISMIFEDLPGISILRLFRAFRVFRLFKRIKSLRMIIEGVLKSLPGVCNAFAVLMLIMSIWAIMAVDFFREDRPVEFGNFVKAVVTFFQIMTYDSWCSGIARDLILEKGWWVSIIFISYVFVNSVMMTNVVVAVLLEKFIDAMEHRKMQERKELAEIALQAAIDADRPNVEALDSAIEDAQGYDSDSEDEFHQLIEAALYLKKEVEAEVPWRPTEFPRGSEDEVTYNLTSLSSDGGIPHSGSLGFEPADTYDRRSTGAKKGGVRFGDVETHTIQEQQRHQRTWEDRAKAFQAEFLRELEKVVSDMDALEKDISQLEGSMSSQIPSSDIHRIEERSREANGLPGQPDSRAASSTSFGSGSLDLT